MSTLAIHGGKPVRTKPFPTWPVFDGRDEQAVLRALRSGKWGKTAGDEVLAFERRFAAYQHAKHGIGVANGTVSLRIALLAAGIKAGDEVIIPAVTFVATATAVVEANATPVFADIDPATFNISAEEIEKAVTPRTRAVIVVHLGGLVCDMDAIMAVAKRHNLIVIEDAAHAHGSEYKGRRVGAIGHMGSFSFQSSKNLNAGEGGIILTDDDALADKCWRIHNVGRAPKGSWYEHFTISGNHRLGELQGALLSSQLERLDEQTDRRAENARHLDAELAKVPGITPQAAPAYSTRRAYHLYCFRFDPAAWGIPRERLLAALAAEGVPVSAGYSTPLYRQPLFLDQAFGPYTASLDAHPGLDYSKVRLPVSERLCTAEGAWLPQNMLLGPSEDMQDIVRAFRKVYDHRAALAESPKAPATARTPVAAGR